MSDHPKVSFVITTYNASRYIRASIAAALASDYQNFEVVVLDDGSSDDTAEICQSLADGRLRFFPRARRGRCRALNEAIALATGQFIAINDADDLSLPARLKLSVDFALRHADLAFLSTNFLKTTEFKDIAAASDCAPVHPPGDDAVWVSRQSLFLGNRHNHSTLLYPKQTWERLGGYDESLETSEDYDFYLRAMTIGRSARLAAPTVLWFTNPGGYYKQRGMTEYARTLAAIKRRVRRPLGLPWWMSAAELLLWYQAGSIALQRRFSSR